jgi:hypothetical protein
VYKRQVWTQTLNLANYPSFGKTGLLLIALIIIVFSVVAWWLRSSFHQTSSNDDSNSGWGQQSFWLGMISIVVAILPFWAADLEVSTRYPYDRFLLAYLFGSCLLLSGLVNQFARNHTLQVIFLSVFISLSTGFQFNQMVRYKNMSAYQHNLIWQLVWRAPDIKPGTTIMANGLPYQDYLTGNAITTEIDWIYGSDQVRENRKLNYMFIFINSPQIYSVEELSPNHKITYDFRTYRFDGSTNQALLIGGNNSGCLRVIDDELTPVPSFVDLYPKPMLDAAFISNLDVITTTDRVISPPNHLFGNEPIHTWCYFFEKAELARQSKNYKQAFDLLKQANAQGYYPKDLTEWYPYIDSALHLGYVDEAAELSSTIITNDSVVKYGVCHTWERFLEDLPPGSMDLQKTEIQLSLMECSSD